MSKGFSVDIKTDISNLVKNEQAIKFMLENEVYVGIQQKYTDRENEKDVTNAELLFIHTNGSPANNIPARPVIEPAIKAHKNVIGNIMKRSAKAAFEGNFSEAIKQLHIAGTKGRDVSKGWFVDPENHWPPNSPETYERKRKKKVTLNRPLIDTGQLRNAISYFVKTKGGADK